MNILDFILIIILIACIFNGYYKGFLREVIDIIGFILGICIFYFIYPIINSWLLKSSLLEKLKTWIIDNLNLANFVDTTQEQIIVSIQNLGIPQIIKDLLIENNNEVFYGVFGANNIVDYIANFVSVIIISLITIFIVILIVSIIINIISKSTGFLARLPIISQFNKIGGLALGLVNGLFTVWLVGIVILILSIFPPLAFLKEQLNGGVADVFINNNILVKGLLNLVLGIIS